MSEQLTTPDSVTKTPGPSFPFGDREADSSDAMTSVPATRPATSDDGGFELSGSAEPLGNGPGTVVNPERRGGAAAPVRRRVGEHSVLRRLFPTDDDGRPSKYVDCEGVRLEHFEVLERIGVGGMSAVFRARDLRLERLVALKVLAPEQTYEPESVQRFLNEARAAARLDHPNIVRSLYVGEVDGVHFIAYEYVEGPNLREIIRRRGRLDTREAVNYTIQIGLALQHASARGIVHRDIKPSNVVVNEQQRVKLVDLGLARLPVGPGAELTIAGTTLGTFDYVSPEQARDPREVDVRSDIYSLGCTLYHMLTGEPPYPEGTVLKKLLDHQGKQPPNPQALNPRVPASLGALCQRMMASSPRRRPATADVLLHELAAVAAELGLHATHPEGFVWGVPRPRSTFLERHLGWMSTVGALLLIVLFLDYLPTLREATRPSTPEGELDTASADRTADRDPSDERVPVPVPGDERSPAHGGTAAEGTRDELPPLLETPGDRTGVTESGTTTPVDNGTSEPRGPISPGDVGIRVPAVGPTELVDSTGVESRPSPEPPLPNDLPPSLEHGDSTVPPPVRVPGLPYTIASNDADVPPRGYTTLGAAVAAAMDGGVVELAFDGERVERPLRVTGKNVVLRGASGFRPVVRFVHENFGSDGDVLRMVTVSNGSVELVNLEIVLAVDGRIPVSSDDRWALVSLSGGKRVDLRVRNTTITIENDDAQPVAVVEVTQGPGGPVMPAMMMQPGEGEAERSGVVLADSFVRGDADVIAVDRTRRTRIDLDNAAFAVDGAVVHLRGSTTPATESSFVDLTCQHVTALVGSGFLRMENGDMRYLPPVQVSANNSIFTTRTARPLVESTGLEDAQSFGDLLQWSGGTNFYDGFTLFWTIPDSVRDPDRAEIDFEAWRALWGATMDRGSVTWRTAPPPTGFERFVPSDLALDERVPVNPAIGGASDGRNAGADLDRLGPLR